MCRFVSALKKSGDDGFAALLRTGAIDVSSVALLLAAMQPLAQTQRKLTSSAQPTLLPSEPARCPTETVR